MKLQIDFDDPSFREFLIGTLIGLAVLTILSGLLLWVLQ